MKFPRECVFVLCWLLAAGSVGQAEEPSGWLVRCYDPPEAFRGHPWPILEATSSGCIYKLANGDEAGFIEGFVLDETSRSLDLGSIVLEDWGFALGQLDLPRPPQAFVVPSDFLCTSQDSCDPEEASYGEFLVTMQGPQLLLTKDHFDSRLNTAHHELFHAVEGGFEGYQLGPPRDWIREGLATAFAQISAWESGLVFDRPEPDQRSFTRPLSLFGAEDFDQLFLAYATSDFWVYLVDGELPEPAAVQTIMDRPGLAGPNDLRAVDGALRALAVEGGLPGAFARFVASELTTNPIQSGAPSRGLELQVDREATFTERLPKVSALAQRGFSLALSKVAGRRVELHFELIQPSGSPDLQLVVGQELVADSHRLVLDYCGAAAESNWPIHVVNTSLDEAIEAVDVEVRVTARVVEGDVCSCSSRRLSFHEEFDDFAPEPTLLRAYVRATIEGQDYVWAEDRSSESLGGEGSWGSVRLGRRIEIADMVYRDSSWFTGQMSNQGGSSEFLLGVATDEPERVLCTPRRALATDSDVTDETSWSPQASVTPSFGCQLRLDSKALETPFVGYEGDVTIERWDAGCWISGRFSFRDSSGRLAEGVFGFDAGSLGLVDTLNDEVRALRRDSLREGAGGVP